MKCPYCKKEAVWTDNSAVYGRSYGNSTMIWICVPCNAYVGCHKNTKEPLGTIANAYLRGLRRDCHRVFDPIWKSGRMTRKDAYDYYSKKYNRDFHIATMDEEQCKVFLKTEKIVDIKR